MNQEEIKRDFYEIILKMYNNEITDLDRNTINKCLNIKSFLKSNPNHELSKKINELLKMYYIKKINNEDLIKAFEIDDKYAYKRQIEVFKNIPLLDKANILFFNNTVIYPSEYYGSIPNYYKGLFWFIESNNGKISPKLKANINNYLKNNKNLFIYTKNSYSTLKEEKQYHYNAQRNILTDNFNNFYNRSKGIAILENRYIDYNQIYFNYLNSKIGNIGELEYFEYLKLLPNTYHVAKDYGDGFGYDIYSYDEKNEKEQLIEVKTTTNPDKELFSLNDNEYKTMVDSLDNPNAEYYVCLMHIDTLNNYKITYQLLKAVDEYTLKSADDEIEYIIDYNFDNTTFINNSYVRRR